MYALASDPDIGPMCGWEPHRSVEDSRRIIRDVFSAPEVCAILSRESGTLLGAVGLQPPSEMFPELPATRQRELGYWLGRAYWGHGIMPEAVQALLRYGFGELKLEAVWCSHYDWNRQSRRVLEKCVSLSVYKKDDERHERHPRNGILCPETGRNGIPCTEKRSLYDRVHHSVSGR